MADPLSVASGVAGLVSLGLTLCNGLHNYFSAIKDRHSDIKTATQSLALFQSNICIIQSSTLKLGHRHALAANGVNAGLKNCETQLKALQAFVKDLNSPENSSGTKQKWQKQRLLARYPFDQKKLLQLQEHLSTANTTLGSFVQSFNLDLNIGISDDLQVLKTDIHENDNITHTMLKAIANRLSTIASTDQLTDMGIIKSSTQIGVEATDTAMTRNQALRGLQPLYIRNSEAERALFRNYLTPECTCLNLADKPRYHQSSYLYQILGGLVISKQTYEQRKHLPGCILYTSSSGKSCRTIKLSYLGLRYMFSRILVISLGQNYPAGAYSFSLGLQTCFVVETSEAFDLFLRDTDDYPWNSAWWSNFDELGPQETTKMVIQQLQSIYASRVASPFDVDVDGNNIAHLCVKAYVWNYVSLGDSEPSETWADLIFILLSYMFDIGVPVTASNFQQGTVLDIICKECNCLRVLPRVYRLITHRDPSFCAFELAHSHISHPLFPETTWVEELDFWANHPEICEGIGFSEIFLAIMQSNQERFEAILKDAKFHIIQAISQTDFHGRTILHAAVPWPTGLTLLLQHEPLLPSQIPDSSLQTYTTPLHLALLYSGVRCNTSDHFTICHNCDCSLSVQLLLEADCSVTSDWQLPDALELCSLQARILFFQHLKNRRKRLRDISLACLPRETIDRYAITPSSLPDAAAGNLWAEVISHTSDLNRQGILVSEGLRPQIPLDVVESLFKHPLHTKVIDLALQFGFRPLDECGLPPLLSQISFSGTDIEKSAAYVNLLLQHNLESSYSSGDFFSTAYHCFGSMIGIYLSHDLQHNDTSSSSLHEFDILLEKVCSSQATSNMPCPCVSEPFDKPLAYLVSGLNGYLRYSGTLRKHLSRIISVVEMIQIAVPNIKAVYLAGCAAHSLTMRSLGIRHFPSCGYYYLWEERVIRDPMSIQEWSEILEEDRLLIDKLHDLDKESEQQFKSRNESVAAFLRGYWWGRMEEVKRDMERPLSGDERRGLLDIGVLLEEDTDDHFDYGSKENTTSEDDSYEHEDITD